ncbi:Tumor suppressor candidate, putative isoform 1 [Hibiscus syriacus]|uniref:Tumor suppressor candidate, putative isoform 1 n=1 Tax=Hibiscus syriacus TaxID=106335 RepID=A0A6A3AS12_HIBSY|nr:Tumor suppressor candidate, putative isoform 1 [Hibiscus syriacus]
MIRGADPNSFSWSLVAQILFKSGKFGKVVRLIDKGIYNSEIYDLVVDFYSKTGDFEAAFHRLNEMNERKLDTSFCTYSSVLDGACKYGNRCVIEKIMRMMIEKQLLPRSQVSGNDLIIQKLCDLKRTHAAEMMFKKACSKNIRLQDDTHGSLLKAISQVGRIDEATNMYRMMLKRGIKVKESCYSAFLNILWLNLVDSASFTIMICELCRLKELRKAMKFHDEMLKMGLKPDKRTYKRMISGFK